MLAYLLYAIVAVTALYVLSRIKDADKANKKSLEENRKLLEEATIVRKESLEVQKQILEELKGLRQEKSD